MEKDISYKRKRKRKEKEEALTNEEIEDYLRDIRLQSSAEQIAKAKEPEEKDWAKDDAHFHNLYVPKKPLKKKKLIVNDKRREQGKTLLLEQDLNEKSARDLEKLVYNRKLKQKEPYDPEALRWYALLDSLDEDYELQKVDKKQDKFKKKKKKLLTTPMRSQVKKMYAELGLERPEDYSKTQRKNFEANMVDLLQTDPFYNLPTTVPMAYRRLKELLAGHKAGNDIAKSIDMQNLVQAHVQFIANNVPKKEKEEEITKLILLLKRFDLQLPGFIL